MEREDGVTSWKTPFPTSAGARPRSRMGYVVDEVPQYGPFRGREARKTAPPRNLLLTEDPVPMRVRWGSEERRLINCQQRGDGTNPVVLAYGKGMNLSFEGVIRA